MERWKRRAPSSASYSSLSSSESESESAPLPPRKFPSKPSKCANSQFTNPNPNHNPEPAVVNNPVARRIKSLEPEEDDSFDHSFVVGTCPFMCPDSERIQRERLRDLAAFERLNGNPGKSSPTLAVKKFCRTISTKNMQLSDVRPLPVLERTLEYLLYLLDSKEHPFEVVHDFIFDRTRSIRQDLSIQNVVNDRAIFLYEEMVKFHIISLHKLQSCSGAPNSSSMHYLNMEQLTKALKSLYDLYEANRNSSSFYTNEAEFRSFYVFLHLCPNSQPMGESLFTWLHNMPSFIIKSKEVSFARTVLRFFRMGNYKRFLSIAAAESSLLQYYILEPHISEVRRLALTCINHGGYKLHPYPLVHLSKLLMMEESDVESLCNSCGLETSMDEFGNKFLPTKQSSFCHSKGQVKSYPLLGLEHMER